MGYDGYGKWHHIETRQERRDEEKRDASWDEALLIGVTVAFTLYFMGWL